MVLLIEDEPQIRRFLRATLGGHGYRLREATSGEDGLIEAATRQPDVVVLDLGLPDIDGLQVIRRLREWSKVPIIVLSARGQEGDKVAALEAGADDYVNKDTRAHRVKLFSGKPITDTGLGEEVARAGWISLELPPEGAHVHAEIVGLLYLGRAPHLL